MEISNQDIKILWGRSGFLCAYGKEELEVMGESRIVGEMAHIVAESKRGPRGHSELNQEERNSYKNLILLCPNHHSMIDADPDKWTVEALLKMKQEHEAWVRSQLAQGSVYQTDFAAIHYLNFFRLLCDLRMQDIPLASFDFKNARSSRSLEMIEDVRFLRDLDMSEMYLAFEVFLKTLPVLRPRAIDLFGDIANKNIGSRVKFGTFFRTKNCQSLWSRSYTRQGNIEKDPHIYCEVGKRKAYFPLDPRWVTTLTAFGTFEEEDVYLTGFGIIKQVTDKRILVSPLVIGVPDI